MRYWTAFEQDQYNGRIAKGSVIPVWTADAQPTFASELTGRGALTFAGGLPTTEEVEKAVDDLGAALVKRINSEGLTAIPDADSTNDVGTVSPVASETDGASG
jgi:hypothetical protein